MIHCKWTKKVKMEGLRRGRFPDNSINGFIQNDFFGDSNGGY